MTKLLALGAIAIALFTARTAWADCTRDGGCASNQYCALADGGDAIDASAGNCALEPCVVDSDCASAPGHVCFTGEEPHECVECRSSADCTNGRECDVAAHTCTGPLAPDAGQDASEPVQDGSAPTLDASPPVEPADANDEASDASDDAEDGGPPDLGSLSGGACDCDLAAVRALSPLAMGSPFALALLFLARRRARRR